MICGLEEGYDGVLGGNLSQLSTDSSIEFKHEFEDLSSPY